MVIHYLESKMKMKVKKIIFIHHGTGIGGAPISLLNLIKGLNSDYYDIKVAFIKDSQIVKIFNKNGIETEIIGASNKYFSHTETGEIAWYYFYKYPLIIYQWLKTAFITAPKYLRKQEADIIHLNSHVLSSWAYAAKKNKFKVVCHNREAVAKGYFGVRHNILRKILDHSTDIIINISKDNEKRLGLIHKSRVVYNFSNIPKSYKTPFSVKSSYIKVLYLGGMAKIKGFESVVDCLKFLNPGIKIQFAGNIGKINSGSGIKAAIKDFLKSTIYRNIYLPLKIISKSGNAEVLGFLSNPLPFIDNCDILITPYKIEHFSRPAIEAFAYGKPVIGSNVEGMDEIIDHGVNGIIIKKNNPKDLAKAINELSQYKDKAIMMGENGREKAQKLFSPEVNIKKVESIYNLLVFNH